MALSLQAFGCTWDLSLLALGGELAIFFEGLGWQAGPHARRLLGAQVVSSFDVFGGVMAFALGFWGQDGFLFRGFRVHAVLSLKAFGGRRLPLTLTFLGA